MLSLSNMRMTSFEDILLMAAEMGPKTIAVAGPVNDELYEALEVARARDMAVAREYANPAEAVAAVRAGDAEVLLKGGVDTGEFMRAVLDAERGLRSGKLISHILVLQAFGRLMLITDGGIVMTPSLEQKAEIIRNALPIAHRLGIRRPRIAVLTASEKVNPRMPETLHAAELSKMDFGDCVVEGPLAVDLAVSPEAARAKGVFGEVAGRADVLLVPSVLVGNIFAKGIMYFGGCRGGGIVAGTSHPVTFLSRSDTAETKLNTIALGILMSGGHEDD